MKQLYKDIEPFPKAIRWLGAVLCGAAYVVCCLPSFYWIGKFGLQMISSILLSFLFTALVFCFLPRSLQFLNGGLSLFLMSMLLFAIYRQIKAQIASGTWSYWWIHTFFYDRPFTVAMVWCSAFVSILLLRLFLPNQDQYSAFRMDFDRFFQVSFRYFLIFYVFVLIYCFILQRKPGGQSGFNLIPFSMLSSYLQSFRYAYEVIFYVVGNFLCFFPFGFYISVQKSKPSVYRVIVTPIVLSLLIEVSQLILNMGHFDIDDILMNSVGFYAGFGIARLFDFLRVRITEGEEQTIFRLN